MHERNITLTQAVRRIAWGYLQLHLNLTLGTFNLLPDWGGYLLLLSTLAALAPSALLLRPLGVLLAVWSGAVWVLALFGVTQLPEFLSLIAAAAALYFHFQFLTELSAVSAPRAPEQARQLLRLRTARTVLVTLCALVPLLPLPQRPAEAVACVLVAANIAVAVWLCAVLFLLSRRFKEGGEEIQPLQNG